APTADPTPNRPTPAGPGRRGPDPASASVTCGWSTGRRPSSGGCCRPVGRRTTLPADSWWLACHSAGRAPALAARTTPPPSGSCRDLATRDPLQLGHDQVLVGPEGVGRHGREQLVPVGEEGPAQLEHPGR